MILVTKDKEKLQNINEAMTVFDEWLNNFEKEGLSKENRPYLPLKTIQVLLPLKKQFKIANPKVEEFYKAYTKANGEYKNLRTVSSGENQPTWDIVRNSELSKLIKKVDEKKPDLWKNDLPTKEHIELILWAYSPDASKFKKNLDKIEEKLGGKNDEESNESEESGDEKKASKRKSKDAETYEESPSKKKKGKK